MFVSTMDDWPWGGSEELWSRAALRLRAEGHEVRVSVAGWPEKRKYLAALIDAGIEVEYHLAQQAAVSSRVWNRVSVARRRRSNRLRRYRPDLLVVSQGHHSGGFAWAKACRRASIPYVFIVHCNSEQWWFHDLDQAVSAYTGARQVFCVSEANLRLLRIQLGELLPHTEVLRNPWNLVPGPIPAWPVTESRLRLALVGRLDPAAKGQDLIFQVLARPEWRARPLDLHLYGSGPFEATLRRMIAMLQLENVHFHGHVADVTGIWTQNHMLVLPSRYEGLPLALVEAMWCGRPAVVTDVGGNAEVCVHGVTGFVADAPTVPAFAAALEQAWQRCGDWQDLGRAARLRLENMMPADPVGLFCERMKQLVANGRARQSLPMGDSKEDRQ